MKTVIHVDGTLIRGNERQTIYLAEALRARGHEIVVSCREGAGVEVALRTIGIRTTGIRPRGDVDPYSTTRFGIWLRRERPDAVLLTSWKRSFVASLAARLAGVPRIVLRIGGPHRIPSKGLSRWKYHGAFAHLIDAIIVNSEELAADVRSQLPDFSPGAIHLIPNVVPAAPTGSSTLRMELGISPNALVVGAVGGLESQKRFDLLVRAFAIGAPPSAHLVIAGSGPEEAALRQLAAELDLSGRLHLLGQRSDVANVLAGCSLFVHPSRSDSMPNAVLEAMRAGIAVIATDVPGVRALLGPGAAGAAAGWIVPRENLEALVATVEEVLRGLGESDPAVAARLSEARRRVRHEFSPDTLGPAYERVLLPPGEIDHPPTAIRG